MLQFTISGKQLLVSETQNFRLTFFNNFFAFSEIKSDRGVNLPVPVNDYNRAILGAPERFEKMRTSNSNRFENLEVRFSGVLIFSGYLVVQKANHKVYDCWLNSTAGNLASIFKNRSIKEVSAFSEDKIFEKKTYYVYGIDEYATPMIFNKGFFSDVGALISYDDESKDVFRLAFRDSNFYIINNRYDESGLCGEIKGVDLTTDYSPYSGFQDSFNINVISPMLFVQYVLKTLLAVENCYFFWSYLDTNPLYRDLCVYNNYDIAKTIILPKQEDWSEKRPTYSTLSRTMTSRAIKTLSREHFTAPFQYKNLLPDLSLKDFLLSIQNISNTFLHFKQLGWVDMLDREKILALPADNIDNYMTGFWEMGEPGNNRIEFTFEHDDDDIIFSENFVSLDDRLSDIKEPVETWRDLRSVSDPEFGEIRFVKEDAVYVEYRMGKRSENEQNYDLPDGSDDFDAIKGIINQETTEEAVAEDAQEVGSIGWFRISIAYQNYIYNAAGTSTIEIPTNLGIISGDFPSTEQKGNMNFNKHAINKFSLRLIPSSGACHRKLSWVSTPKPE